MIFCSLWEMDVGEKLFVLKILEARVIFKTSNYC